MYDVSQGIWQDNGQYECLLDFADFVSLLFITLC